MAGYMILIGFICGQSITWSYPTGVNVLSSPAVADINTLSPGSEIVFADAYDGDKVYCLSSSGGLLWSCNVGGGVYTSPIIANLGHPKDPAIITGPRFQKVVCINNDGSIRWEFPLPSEWGSAPVVANIDTIGAPEILFGCTNKYLYCLDSNGGELWTFQCGEPINAQSPAVANIDKAGMPEIIITTYSKLYCLNSNGFLKWSTPLPNPAPPAWGFSHGVSPSIADVDLDGEPEIIVGDMCFEANGDLRWHYGLSKYSTSAICDLDYDNIPEIVVWDGVNLMYALKDSAGIPVVVWTADAQDPSGTEFTTPIICDIIGDSARDVLWVAGSDGSGYLRIYDGGTGIVLYENTAFSSTTCSEHGVAAADIDNDGIVEVVALYGCSGIALLEDDANWAKCDKNRFSGHLYHITGINPDLSVPKSEPYSWEIHNTWLAQIYEDPFGIGERDERLEIRQACLGDWSLEFRVYPNPSTQKTEIRFQIPEPRHPTSDISLKIYDLAGRVEKVLFEGNLHCGSYSRSLDLSNFSSGIYFLRLEVGNRHIVRKLEVFKN